MDTSQPGPEQARLAAALEEEFDGARAPDYRHLLRRRRPRPWLAAALLLLGATVVLLVWQQLRAPTPQAPDGDPLPAQDLPAAIEVPDPQTFARLCGQIRGLRIRILVGESTRFRHAYPGFEPPWLPVEVDQKALIRELRRATTLPRLAAHKEGWDHQVSLRLADGRRMEVALRHLGDGKTQLLNVRGMPALQAPAALSALLRPKLRLAEYQTSRHSGVYNLPLLQHRMRHEGDGFAPTRLRLIGVSDPWLADLAKTGARRSLRHLDLRDGRLAPLPKAPPRNAAQRRAVEVLAREHAKARQALRLDALPQFAALERLYLRGTNLDLQGLQQVTKLPRLTELRILEPYEDSRRSNAFAAHIPRLDDRCLPVLGRLRQLRVFEAPGLRVSSAALKAAGLGKAWPALELLNLSHCPHLDGSELATFDGHPHLQRLLLCDLPGLSDAGVRCLNTLPRLRYLDLSQEFDRHAGRSRSPKLLSDLASLRQLEVLVLDHWFSRSRRGQRPTSRRIELGQRRGRRSSPQPPQGQPGVPRFEFDLEPAWRSGLHTMLRRLRCQRLSLRHCVDLRIPDLQALREGSQIQEIDLHHCPGLDADALEELRRTSSTRLLGPR